MDYEIKARLAQVPPTMAANVLHNLRLSRRGEAGRKEGKQGGIWEKKKETEQSIHQQTIATNPLFSFMILLPCRTFLTFALMFRATSKALSWVPRGLVCKNG